MPKINTLRVYCWNCQRRQPDEGVGQTCIRCGFSPLPSYSYPKLHINYPVSKLLAAKKRKRLTPKPKLPL